MAGAQWFGSAVPTFLPAQHGESLQSTFFSFLGTRTQLFQDSNTQDCGCEVLVSQLSSNGLGAVVLGLSCNVSPLRANRRVPLGRSSTDAIVS